MKAFQARYKILFLLVLIGIVAAIVLSYWFLPQVLLVYKAYWFLAVAAAVIVFTPLGNKRLAVSKNEKPRKKFSLWILQILLFELSLMAVFFGVCVLIGQPQLMTNTFSYFTVQMGAFPWTGIALLACTMGFLSYYHKKNAYLSTVLHPILRTKPNSTIEIIINSLPRAATLFAFGGTLAFYTLLIAKLFVPQQIDSLRGLSTLSAIFFFLLIILTANNFVKRKIFLFTVHIRMPMFFRIGSLLLLLTLLVSVLSLFLGSAQGEMAQTPTFIHSLRRHGWLLNWHLFAIFWWMAWAPIVGIFVAKLSRGYSWRSIILVVLALPILLGLLAHYGYLPLANIPHWLGIVIALVGFLLFFAIITPDHTFDAVMQTYLPKQDVIKYRATDRFLFNIILFSVLMICFYLAGGIVLLGLLFFAFMMLLSITLLLLPAMLGSGL